MGGPESLAECLGVIITEPTGHLRHCLHGDDDVNENSVATAQGRNYRQRIQRSCTVQVTGKKV